MLTKEFKEEALKRLRNMSSMEMTKILLSIGSTRKKVVNKNSTFIEMSFKIECNIDIYEIWSKIENNKNIVEEFKVNFVSKSEKKDFKGYNFNLPYEEQMIFKTINLEEGYAA